MTSHAAYIGQGVAITLSEMAVWWSTARGWDLFSYDDVENLIDMRAVWRLREKEQNAFFSRKAKELESHHEYLESILDLRPFQTDGNVVLHNTSAATPNGCGGQKTTLFIPGTTVTYRNILECSNGINKRIHSHALKDSYGVDYAHNEVENYIGGQYLDRQNAFLFEGLAEDGSWVFTVNTTNYFGRRA